MQGRSTIVGMSGAEKGRRDVSPRTSGSGCVIRESVDDAQGDIERKNAENRRKRAKKTQKLKESFWEEGP